MRFAGCISALLALLNGMLDREENEPQITRNTQKGAGALRAWDDAFDIAAGLSEIEQQADGLYATSEVYPGGTTARPL